MHTLEAHWFVSPEVRCLLHSRDPPPNIAIGFQSFLLEIWEWIVCSMKVKDEPKIRVSTSRLLEESYVAISAEKEKVRDASGGTGKARYKPGTAVRNWWTTKACLWAAGARTKVLSLAKSWEDLPVNALHKHFSGKPSADTEFGVFTRAWRYWARLNQLLLCEPGLPEEWYTIWLLQADKVDGFATSGDEDFLQ